MKQRLSLAIFSLVSNAAPLAHHDELRCARGVLCTICIARRESSRHQRGIRVFQPAVATNFDGGSKFTRDPVRRDLTG